MIDPMDASTPSKSCGCTIVGSAFIVGGALFVGVGAWVLGRAIKSRREWREYERRKALALAPSFGRSARGTFTTGLELRF